MMRGMMQLRMAGGGEARGKGSRGGCHLKKSAEAYTLGAFALLAGQLQGPRPEVINSVSSSESGSVWASGRDLSCLDPDRCHRRPLAIKPQRRTYAALLMSDSPGIAPNLTLAGGACGQDALPSATTATQLSRAHSNKAARTHFSGVKGRASIQRVLANSASDPIAPPTLIRPAELCLSVRAVTKSIVSIMADEVQEVAEEFQQELTLSESSDKVHMAMGAAELVRMIRTQIASSCFPADEGVVWHCHDLTSTYAHSKCLESTCDGLQTTPLEYITTHSYIFAIPGATPRSRKVTSPFARSWELRRMSWPSI